MRKFLFLSSSILSFVIPTGAFAQAPTKTVDASSCEIVDGEDSCFQATKSIVVRGNALNDPIGDEAFNIVSIKPNPQFRLENELRKVPGLQQFRASDARSANPTSQGITLRGLSANAASRALLLLDGVPQSDPFGGWVAWPGYDALPIAEARIKRGGGSGADGQGALSGTIELFSDDIGNALDVSAAYGSRNTFESKLAVGRELGQGQLTLSASYARGDGFIPIIEEQRGSIDRQAAFEQAGVALRFVAPLTEGTELQANVRAFTDDRERGFAFSENHNDGVDASIRLVNRDSDSLQYSALAYVQIRNFDASFGGGIPADRNSVNQVFEQFNVPSTGLGARIELRPNIGDKAELRIGGDWRRTVGETNERFFFQGGVPQRGRNAGGESDTYGIFSEISVQPNEKLVLTGGARVDFWNISDGFISEFELISPFPGAPRLDVDFDNRSGTEFTGRGGFVYNINEKLSLNGAAYLGWRLPTLNELFRPFRVGPDATAANEFLEPEQSEGVDLGLAFDDGQYQIGVTLFYNRLEDAIANVTLDSGPGFFPGVGFVSGAGLFAQRQNIDAVESQGVEFDAKFNVSDILSVGASYSYIDANIDSSGDAIAINGLRPEQVANHYASGFITYEDDAGNNLSLSATYLGSRFEDDINSLSLSDSLKVDASAIFKITNNIGLNARIENIFDAQIEAAISSSGIIERTQPRTILVGLQLSL